MSHHLLDGAKIKKLLVVKHWSQETLAGRARVGIRQVQRLLNGGKTSIETRDKLATALGVTWQEISLPDGMSAGSGQIPHKNPRLFGRDTVLRDLVERLRKFGRTEAGQENVLGVHGMPGLGKTAIAVALV